MQQRQASGGRRPFSGARFSPGACASGPPHSIVFPLPDSGRRPGPGPRPVHAMCLRLRNLKMFVERESVAMANWWDVYNRGVLLMEPQPKLFDAMMHTMRLHPHWHMTKLPCNDGLVEESTISI